MAIGYIYYIINKINNKRYVGKTHDLQHRLECHFSDLKLQKHHSHKLQRSVNKYGIENFTIEYKQIEYNTEEEFNLIEIKEIEKYDSYYNGYNETLGGDGNKTSLNFHDSVLVFNICQNYKGVNRKIAGYFHCDHTVIDQLAKNKLYSNISYDQQEYRELIEKIGISEENCNENYVPHNEKKLTDEQALELLAIITQTTGYQATLCSIFNVNPKLAWRLKQGLIYKNVFENFEELSSIEKEKICNDTLKKYNIISASRDRLRKRNKEALTQEQINYILDNKDKKTRVQIGKDLGISADRVGSVCLGKSYKDLIENYYSSTK